MRLANLFPASTTIFGVGVELDDGRGLVVNVVVLHDLAQMLELSLIEVRIDDNTALVHQMSEILGFESDQE